MDNEHVDSGIFTVSVDYLDFYTRNIKHRIH